MRQAVVVDVELADRVRPRGSMLAVCPEPGCTKLTMGGTCVEHDPPVTITYERGRPYRAPATATTAAIEPAPTLAG